MLLNEMKAEERKKYDTQKQQMDDYYAMTDVFGIKMRMRYRIQIMQENSM